MATHAQKLKLGIFVATASVLMITTILIFAGIKIGEDRASYTIYFKESVSGLELGAPVKLRGVRVGVVQEIQVDPESVEQVKVLVALQPGTPIKTDSTAILVFQGITGLKFIEIQDGTATAGLLPRDSVIPEGKSIVTLLTGRAEDLTIKAEQVLNNIIDVTRPENRKKIDNILTETELALINFNKLSTRIVDLLDAVMVIIDDNRKPLKSAIVAVSSTAKRADGTMASVEGLVTEARTTLRGLQLETTVGDLRETNKLLQDKLLDVDLSGTIQRVAVTLGALQIALEQMSQVVGQNKEQLRATMYNIRIATESLKQFGRQVESDPSQLLFAEPPQERDIP